MTNIAKFVGKIWVHLLTDVVRGVAVVERRESDVRKNKTTCKSCIESQYKYGVSGNLQNAKSLKEKIGQF